MLFTTNAYRKDVRPSIDQTKPTQIFLDLYLVGLNGIDEVSHPILSQKRKTKTNTRLDEK
jgi:hypothetical protein